MTSRKQNIFIKFCFFGLSLAALSLSSCATKKEETPSAETAYIKAYNKLKEKDYLAAGDEFEKLDSEYPFSRWATKGKIMSIYARYKEKDYAKIISQSDEFLQLNSNSQYVPYVLYMKGLAYFEQMPEINRAQDPTQQASYTFRELVARFPESEYAKDAKSKIALVDEHLAGTKMSTARYQIKEKNFVGAILNFQEVINRYRQTNQVEEAHYRLAEIYFKIGLHSEGVNNLNRLRQKNPQSPWLKIAQNLPVKSVKNSAK